MMYYCSIFHGLKVPSIFFQLFLVIILTSCSSSKEQTQSQDTEPEKTEAVDEEPFLVYRKTPCYGRCPVFKVSFYPNREVLYEGRQNVGMEGTYVAQLPSEQYEVLIQIIEHTPFKDMKDGYPDRGEAPVDLPSTVTYVNHEDTQKEITNFGDNPPSELTQFEELIEELISVLEWVRK